MVKAGFISSAHNRPAARAAAPAAGPAGEFADRIRELFAGEAERLSLWAPVALGAGAAAYFSLEFEPSLLLTLSLLAIAIFAGALLQNLRTAFAAASVFLLGFAAADFRLGRQTENCV